MTEHHKLNNFSPGKKIPISVSLFLQTNATSDPHSNLFSKTLTFNVRGKGGTERSVEWVKVEVMDLRQSGLKPRPVNLGPVLLPSQHN